MTALHAGSEVRYRITISGHLGPELQAVFEDLRIVEADGATILAGPLDQAALFGVINRIRVNFLRLVEVRRDGG